MFQSTFPLMRYPMLVRRTVAYMVFPVEMMLSPHAGVTLIVAVPEL